MDSPSDRAQAVSEIALERELSVAVAESLTSGAVASALGAAPQASQWFRGGVVAYSSEVKHTLLDVPPGPVVSEEAVTAMATRTRELLGADVVLAVSGAGGPDGQDGQPPGTVWFATASPVRVVTEHQRFDGDPPAVVEQTVDHGLALLQKAAQELSGSSAGDGS